jgi:hypothetical protein
LVVAKRVRKSLHKPYIEPAPIVAVGTCQEDYRDLEFTRMNIELTILRKKIEDLREVRVSMPPHVEDLATGKCGR